MYVEIVPFVPHLFVLLTWTAERICVSVNDDALLKNVTKCNVTCSKTAVFDLHGFSRFLCRIISSTRRVTDVS